jgi:L,D-peptidoglycan transpeptidase YkuD (ErfK/YbiS/YcfS/YnhG family)
MGNAGTNTESGLCELGISVVTVAKREGDGKLPVGRSEVTNVEIRMSNVECRIKSEARKSNV